MEQYISEFLPQIITAIVGFVSTGGLALIFNYFCKSQKTLTSKLTDEIVNNKLANTLRKENELLRGSIAQLIQQTETYERDIQNLLVKLEVQKK